MKKMLFSLFTISILASCQKDDNTADPVKDAVASLQGRYLICDSVKTTVGGRTTTQVLGKGKGWDLSFGMYGNLEVYSSPTVYKSFSYEKPDKIYYWNANSSYTPDQYYTIISANSSKLVLKDTEASSGKIFTEYFSAE